jgi:hypothetical protein
MAPKKRTDFSVSFTWKGPENSGTLKITAKTLESAVNAIRNAVVLVDGSEIKEGDCDE